MVIDALPEQQANETILCLASLMNLISFHEGHWVHHETQDILSPEDVILQFREYVLAHTLIRKMEKPLVDVDAFPHNKRSKLRTDTEEALRFVIKKRDMPETIPENWIVKPMPSGDFEVLVDGALQVILNDTASLVKSAGQLFSGFDAGKLSLRAIIL